jgi:predicted transcriptional regulator
MPVGNTQRLGDLQLAIMHILWEMKEASVADVHAALKPTRNLALTTVATMLRKLEQKGVVNHRVDGRQFIYRSTLAQSEVQRSMIGYVIRRLFDGDAKALLSHLVAEGEIDAAELAELQAMIAEHRAGKGDAHAR